MKNQPGLVKIFGTTRNNITLHLSNVFEKELSKNSVCKEFLHTARDVLDNPSKVSHKVAKSFALSEFEKYRITQDKLFESDFDKFMIKTENNDING